MVDVLNDVTQDCYVGTCVNNFVMFQIHIMFYIGAESHAKELFVISTSAPTNVIKTVDLAKSLLQRSYQRVDTNRM
jgi:hypothetical protein